MNDRRSLWLLSLISALILILLYSPLILNPSSTLLNGGEDGFKNYYVYLYHILHDSGYVTFEGMNYPYGEFILYTDSQPLLSTLLKFFQADLSTSLAVMHLLIWLSIFLLPIFSFLLFRSFGINVWIAFLFALAALMLNPQIYRLGGHYGLSYACFIPAVWYFLRRFLQQNRSKYLIYILVSMLICIFLHVYLGLICAALVIIWTFISAWFQKDWKIILKPVLVAILPIVLVFSLTKILDTHAERSSRPYGVFEYNANPASLFLPHHGPIASFLNHKAGIQNEKWEGWAYPGLAVWFFIAAFLIAFRKDKNRQLRSTESGLFVFMLFFVILSMALPFRSIGQELLDLFPPLRQFRSLGRFAWLSFYALLIISGIAASQLWQKSVLLKTFVIAAVLSMCIEGLWQQLALRKILNAPMERLTYEGVIPPVDAYQAMLPLPYFHTGSDNTSIAGNPEHNAMSMAISLTTGIPLMAADESRLSWVEARELSRILSSESGTEKQVLQLLNKKPLLLFSQADLSPSEEKIWNMANILEQNAFKSLDPINLINDPGVYWDHKADSSFQLTIWPELGISDSGLFWFFNDFENNATKSLVMSGKGAFSEPRNRHKKIADFEPYTFASNTRYELSFWVWTGEEDRISEMIVIEEYDAQSDYKEWRYVSALNSSVEMMGDWHMAKMEFDVARPESRLSVMLRGSVADKRPCVIDQLLIRDLRCNITAIDTLRNKVYLNNQWYPIKSD